MIFDKLQEALSNVQGSTFVGLDTETVVKLKGGKKNEMQGRVTKRMVGANTMLFTNSNTNGYQNMVKKRLESEGKDPESFELKPRAWGTRIANTPFVEHKGTHYLETIFLNSGETEYFLDGKPIEKDEIEGLPAERSTNAEAQGGLDNQVTLRTFKVDSITSIRVNGETIV